MGTDTVTIIIMIVLIAMSAYFSSTETAFSAANKSKLKNMADKGNKKADLVLKILDNYDKFLSTILIGNNIVNICVASIGTVLFIKYFGEAKGPTISTAVVTLAVLIFGEISPKSLAKDAPESFSMFSAPFINVLMKIFTPVNFLFSCWKKLLSKVIKKKDDRRMTDDELITIFEEAAHEGSIDEQESELLKSVIEFNEQDAQDILTPRVDLEAVSIDDPMDEIENKFFESGYSRLPVYKDSIDNIIGIIHHKDFHMKVHRGSSKINDIMNPPVFVTPTMKIGGLLKLLQKEKSHIAVVTDEYGGTMGIVTMEDILEELVGEIWDEHDEVIEEFTMITPDRYKVMGSTDLDDMFEFFKMPEEDAEKSESTSVSGWIMEIMERIPDEGDSFEYKNLRVTVTKTDSKRVTEIIVDIIPPEMPENEDAEKEDKTDKKDKADKKDKKERNNKKNGHSLETSDIQKAY